MNFQHIKSAVAAQFEKMQSSHQLYRADVSADELWQTYLASFPDGSNPRFRERTEHDCSCCKQFVRTIGNVVSIDDGGNVHSLWDVTVSEEPAYQAVVDAMAKLVRSKAIDRPFLHSERAVGTDKNFEQLVGGEPRRWDHFHVQLRKELVVTDGTIDRKLGELRTTHDLLARAIGTITYDALDTVLELIAQNSIYRGAEHKFAVIEFRKLKVSHDKMADQDAFLWWICKFVPESVSRIRNTAIGTLLVDLSEGAPLDKAVASFEVKVAPQNYRRTTALVTKSMIDKAKAKIEELGLTSALERRYATIDDVSINDVLFADRSAKPVAGSVFDELAVRGVDTKSFDRVEEVTIDKFLSDIVPRAQTIEVLFENRHEGNLVSLIAPADPTSGQLFKWDNRFSWSYNGEVADSIKERVKKAGGNVTGDLCCRLAWDGPDDLDLYLREPNGHVIYFADRRSAAGGHLDVDANGGNGPMANPVENIVYPNLRRMLDGTYSLWVNNYRWRTGNQGFEVEIDFLGTIHKFSYPKPVRDRETVEVATFQYSLTDSLSHGLNILKSLPSTTAPRTLWGLRTQDFRKVRAITLSPNYWGERGVGNKHYFFMLDGCVNDGMVRGFYNEFLKPELDAHRKVFEMVGSKLRPIDSAHQLSGLGFSSTQKNTLVCRVKGSFSRIVKIHF